MAMDHHPHIGGTIGLILGPVRDVLRFRGRATRTETAVFLLLSQSLVLALFAIFRPLGLDLAADFAWAALSVPLFALVARRLHDIGVPGWPGPLLVGAGLMLQASGGALIGTTAEAPARVLAGLALLAIALWQPTAGANRYGIDPRRDRKSAAA